MRLKRLGSLACLVAATAMSVPARAADDGDAEKIETKKIMKDAFKGDLLKKVASGSGSAEDAANLHKMLVALSKNEPPKGDAESWKKLTEALVKAGKAAVDGDKDAAAMLKKASNCKACHSEHKPG